MEDEQIVQDPTDSEFVADAQVEQAPVGEWTAAALAHASALLTIVLGVAGGIGLLVGPAVPLVMYFGYRGKSRFVAFHALQSLVYHVAGVLLYLVLVVVVAVWVAIAWTVSGLLSAILVGLLLIPLAVLFTLLMVFLLICIPFAWLGYGLYGVYQVYQGRDFRYWLIGEWLEQEVKL